MGLGFPLLLVGMLLSCVAQPRHTHTAPTEPTLASPLATQLSARDLRMRVTMVVMASAGETYGEHLDPRSADNESIEGSALLPYLIRRCYQKTLAHPGANERSDSVVTFRAQIDNGRFLATSITSDPAEDATLLACSHQGLENWSWDPRAEPLPPLSLTRGAPITIVVRARRRANVLALAVSAIMGRERVYLQDWADLSSSAYAAEGADELPYLIRHCHRATLGDLPKPLPATHGLEIGKLSVRARLAKNRFDLLSLESTDRDPRFLQCVRDALAYWRWDPSTDSSSLAVHQGEVVHLEFAITLDWPGATNQKVTVEHLLQPALLVVHLPDRTHNAKVRVAGLRCRTDAWAFERAYAALTSPDVLLLTTSPESAERLRSEIYQSVPDEWQIILADGRDYGSVLVEDGICEPAPQRWSVLLDAANPTEVGPQRLELPHIAWSHLPDPRARDDTRTLGPGRGHGPPASMR